MSDLSVFTSRFEPGSTTSASNRSPRQAATLVGSLSILFWAMWPSLALFSSPAPTFQILAIGQAVGFAALALMRIIRGESLFGMLPRRWPMLAFGVLGVFGTNALNFLAITRIPAAQASIINYTWPVVALMMSGMLGIAKLYPRHYGAMTLGFIGVVVIISPWNGLKYDALGILLAFSAALCYASYTVYRQFDHTTPSDAVGIYGLIAAIACTVTHFSVETTVAMSSVQLLATIVLGIAPMGFGYALWDYGVARGDARLMTVLAYGTPLFATLFLIGLGFASFSLSLVAGAGLIIAGAALGTKN